MKIPKPLPRENYVYVHKRNDTGKVFYVGKGRNRRAWRWDNRNPHWLHVAKRHGFSVVIVREGMNKDCAMSLEKSLIRAYGIENLCNYTLGGDGTGGAAMKEETKLKLSHRLGMPVWNDAGERFPSRNFAAKEMRKRGYERASQSGIYSAVNNPGYTVYGHSWSHKGIPEKPDHTGYDAISANKSIPVVCIDTGEIFKSASAASVKYGFGPRGGSKITACCRGRQKTCMGMKWRYLND